MDMKLRKIIRDFINWQGKKKIKIAMLIVGGVGIVLMIYHIGWLGTLGIFLLLWANNTNYKRKY